MVRTRNNRNGSGGGSPSKESSSSFKPSTSGNKKGRKRQLTESSVSSQASVLTQSAALSPVPGPGPSSTQPGALLSPGCYSHHGQVASFSVSDTPSQPTRSRHAQYDSNITQPVHHAVNSNQANTATAGNTPEAGGNTSHEATEEHDMEPQISPGGDRVWQETQEQGYLAPGASLTHGALVGSTNNFTNNNYQNNNNTDQEHNIQDTGAQDLIESHHTDDNDHEIPPAADLVIFGNRDSAGPSAPLEKDLTPIVLPDDLKQNLECPVCARISLPPIMQCRNGHVTCNPCRLKVQSCPMCREIDIDIRNLFAEKAVTFMSIPCEFKTYGCRVEIQYKDKESHERVCKFRPYICPYIECDHKLAADAVVMHVSTAHREECRRSDGPEITASMILIGMYFGGDGAWSPRVITCFGRTFFDVALTRDRWLHHWVWLLGEEEEAGHYLYEITAFKGNTKYVYGSEVASLRTSDDEIVSEGKCLSISDAIGRRLRDGDKIRYKLKLMRK